MKATEAVGRKLSFFQLFVLAFAWLLLLAIGVHLVYEFMQFVVPIVRFPFDWEATDGDHLNFISRILNGKPIYTDWDTGPILDIYNPGYHYLVALISIAFGFGFPVARMLSFSAFIGCLAVVFIAVSRGFAILPGWQRILLSFTAVLSIYFVSLDGMFTDLIHVNPNTIFAFWGVLSLLLLDYWGQSRSRNFLVAAGSLAFLSIISKQQGMFAVASGIVYLGMRRASVEEWASYLVPFFFLLISATGYLEYVNDGNYLNSTFFYLREVILNDPGLMKRRLYSFVLTNWIWLLLPIASISFFFRRIKLSVWDIAVPVNVLVLGLVLGNGGGGNYYFFPTWLCLVVCFWRSLCSVMERAQLSSLVITNICARWRSGLIALFLALVGTGLSSGIRLIEQFHKYRIRTAELTPVMSGYYAEVSRILAQTPDKYVFAARTAGAFVLAGADMDYEYCTLFSYAWSSKTKHVNREDFLSKLRLNKFSVISTGLQPFPDAVAREIEKHYRLFKVMPVGLNWGNIGQVKIYVPSKGRESNT